MPEPASPHNLKKSPLPSGVSTGSGPMGQYYLLEKIAQGGMAEIYKGLAYDLHGIKRTVVIKKILPNAAANKEFIDMLVAEAKIAVMLSQGNIAQIYDLGKAGDNYFIVMEYVDGRSISQIMKHCAAVEQRIPLAIVCHIIAEIAAGLDYMHRRTDEHGQPLGIIHRDVSPQNVIASYSGTVKIIDFGIAKARTKLENTDAGILKGKFAYMSPEQAEGDPIDHRSDIFSLGVILHEMLTGQRLFKAKENRETLRNVRKAVVPLPSSIHPDIPPELDRIVAKALMKQRTERYAFASELRNDLLRFLHRDFPEFRPSEFTEYLTTLFRTDPVAESEDDAKTPLLIIDHTQSAIADPAMLETTHVGAKERESSTSSAIVADYLLTMEEPENPTRDPGPGTRDTENEEEVSEYTPIVRVAPPARWKSWRVLWISVGILLVVSGSWFVVRHRSHQPQITNRISGSAAPGAASSASGHESRITNHEPQTTNPAPFASLTISTTPPGAQIFLDDQATNLRTPATFDHLDAGKTYTIGVFLERYKFAATQWTAHAGLAEEIQLPLAIDYGTVAIVAIPEGAAIMIDGESAGRAPLTQGALMPGRILTIRAQAPGYRPWQERVQVEPGKSITVRAVLQPAAPETIAPPDPQKDLP